jgi:hypothetical protein
VIKESLFQFVQDGRCQSKSTLFRAHLLDTHMQFNRSCGLLSFENIPIRTSAGRRFAGERQVSSETAMSWNVGTPMDDCESLLPA